jgi:hypothetical protein
MPDGRVVRDDNQLNLMDSTMNVSIKVLALTLAVSCIAAFGASNATAQGYGTGQFHHSEHGYLGASGHFSYGDMYNNRVHSHVGTHYQSGYRGYTPRTMYYYGYSVPSLRYTGPMSADGHPTGQLCPGMILPDGATVVSVGN